MTRRRFIDIWLIVLAGATLVESACAEPLGRLFLTPERRATLDQQRRSNIREAQTLEGDTVSLDGVVTRSSGRSTVWVNQRAQNEHVLGTGITAVVSAKSPARAVLTPGDEPSASLKVGEAYNRGTRERTDGLGGGRVVVNRKP
jgi:hypothetical protein